MLQNLPRPHSNLLLTDWASGEDAAVWTIDSRRAGILTVDFITPIVDDPRNWGAIAAANSLSDVYAMGGRPLVALNVVCFPSKKLDITVLQSILEGGTAKINEAGAFLAGGHSVEDDEPKFGLVVFGEVPIERIWKVTGAQADDALILTKPIGTGVIATAIKADMASAPYSTDEAIRWMTTLNDVPARLASDLMCHIHACTDVTGFGLVGHALDMVSGRGLDAAISVPSLPLLSGVIDLAEMGLLPAGTYGNRITYRDRVREETSCPETHIDMAFDAQTSGGLLLAVGGDNAIVVRDAIRTLGFSQTEIIGRFREGTGSVHLVD